MFTETEMIQKARQMFPNAEDDLTALNLYAAHIKHSIREYHDKPKITRLMEAQYHEIVEIRNHIKNKEN